MDPGAKRLSRLSVLLGLVAAGCAVTPRQPVPLDLSADAPNRSTLGRSLGSGEREAWATAMTGRWTAEFPCPQPPCSRTITIVPVATHLGAPPDPATVAARMAPDAMDDPDRRELVQRAYYEEVRTRYRLWGDHVLQQIVDADVVEIDDDGVTRRYRSGEIVDGVRASLGRIADRYASHEWARFAESGWAMPRDTPRAAVARRRRAPATPSNASPSPSPSPTPVTTAVPEPASAASAAAASCRQACTLRHRACLARCRGEPVEGGAYDGCRYDCEAIEVECGAGCGAPSFEDTTGRLLGQSSRAFPAP